MNGGRTFMRFRLALALGSLVVGLVCGEAVTFAGNAAATPIDCIIEETDDRCELWTNFYDGHAHGEDVAGDGHGLAHRFLVTSHDDSTVFVVGTEDMTGQDSSGGEHVVAIAYDTSTGEHKWVSASEDDSPTEAKGLSLSPDGRTLFVLAYRPPSSLVFAYDTETGEELWKTAFEYPLLQNGKLITPARTMAGAIASSSGPDGVTRVFVGGRTFDPEWAKFDRTNSWTVAYDVAPDGSLVGQAWSRLFTGSEGQHAYSGTLVASPDGSTVYQLGRGLGREEFAAVAYRAEDGEPLWRSYPVPAGGQLQNLGGIIDAVAVDGRLFATGLAWGVGFETIAFDGETGKLQWRETHSAGSKMGYGGQGNIVVSAGRVFIMGWMVARGGAEQGFGWTIAAYDEEDGRLVWQVESTDNPSPANTYEWGPAMAATPSGDSLFVTGPRIAQNASVATTISYDAATGAQRWSARYVGRGSWPASITTSRDGRRVFVAGMSHPLDTSPIRTTLAGSADLMMLAYDA